MLVIRKIQYWINYLFPLNYYSGENITQIRWVRFFIPFAPYTAIILSVSLMLWAGLGYQDLPFLMTPPGGLSLVVSFFVFILFRIAIGLRNHRRSTALPLLIASFLPLVTLLGLALTIGFVSSVRERFDRQHKAYAKSIENKIQEEKDYIAEKTKNIDQEFRRAKEYNEARRKEIDDRMGDVDQNMKSAKEALEKNFNESYTRAVEFRKKFDEAEVKFREACKKASERNLFQFACDKKEITSEAEE